MTISPEEWNRRFACRSRAAEVLSVDDVVEATSPSRRLLERHFKDVVGTSVYQEIQRTHIERACQMLVETSWSMAEIAERCGFSSPVHFRIAFKRHMHTDRRYRRLERQRRKIEYT